MARFLTCTLLLVAAAGCKGPEAEVTGNVLGIAWGETKSVYFGAPFIVLSNIDAGCEDVAWVERNYDEGESPMEGDAQLLQFVYVDGTIETGQVTVDVDAAVQATMLAISGGTMTLDRASGGIVNLEVVDDDWVEGRFEAVQFDDASVTGTFTAEWCRNLGD